jgi:ubiquinone/menaquinone biosynthesis C-methylase UbiE
MAATVSLPIYSIDDITRTYREVPGHIGTRRHIERYSENPDDIRDIALQGLDLSGVKSALDLGCGYGFFTEKLARRLQPGAEITGIDLVDEGCRDVFLNTVTQAGGSGRFLAAHADTIADMPDALFDIVYASYSLYFFPDLISDIARILKPHGFFLTITHSQESLREIIRFIPAACSSGLAITRLLRMFSAENGRSQLQEYFNSIEQLPYLNRLVFPHESIDDCCDYLSKKQGLLFKEVAQNTPQELDRTVNHFLMEIRQHVELNRCLAITKNDCVFRCRNPKRDKEQ